MKKLLSSLTAVALLFASCSQVPINQDTQITLAASLAARVSFSLIPASHRQGVANYEWFIGSAMYALTNAPTPDSLTQLLTSVIPAQDLTAFPEIKTLVIPAVVDVYTSYYNLYSTNLTKLLQIVRDIASGVQAIAAQYK